MNFDECFQHRFRLVDAEFSVAASGQLIGNTGKLIWDATKVVMHLMQREVQCIARKGDDDRRRGLDLKAAIAGKVVVELGCGTGILGIASAILQCKEMILTDLPIQLPLIKYNVQNNAAGLGESTVSRISCLDHYWGSETIGDFSIDEIAGKLDVLLCSDLLFCAIRDSLQEEFLQSMLRLTSKNPQCLMVFAFEDRVMWKEAEFMERMRLHFDVQEVDLSDVDLREILNAPEEEEDTDQDMSLFYQPPSIHVFLCKPQGPN